MDTNSKIRIVAIRRLEDPKVEEIDSGLDAMQAFVGGYIECVRLDGDTFGHGVDLWCNEEGLFKCQPNRLLCENGREVPLHGDLFIAAHDGEGETIGLTEAEAEEWRKRAASWPRSIF